MGEEINSWLHSIGLLGVVTKGESSKTSVTPESKIGVLGDLEELNDQMMISLAILINLRE